MIINNNKYFDQVIIKNEEVLQIENNNIFKNNFLISYFNNKNNIQDLDIILVGYNSKSNQKPDFLIKTFVKLNIKYEIMESMAAYKTHNILVSENRKVLTILDIL